MLECVNTFEGERHLLFWILINIHVELLYPKVSMTSLCHCYEADGKHFQSLKGTLWILELLEIDYPLPMLRQLKEL